MMELKCVVSIGAARHENDEEPAEVLYKGTSYCGKHFRELLSMMDVEKSEENLVGLAITGSVTYRVIGVPDEDI